MTNKTVTCELRLSKMKFNTTVPSTPETNLIRLTIAMNQFTPRYPTDDEWLFPITTSIPIGNLWDYNFYMSDDKVRNGFAFCVSYNAAKQSNNNKEICSYIGSMICNVHCTEFRTPVEEALHRIDVRPVVKWLPSQTVKHNREKDKVPQMDWPSILVYFACCIILLFKKCIDEVNYNTFMSNCIRDLREIVGCDPDADVDIPFDFARANAIRTLLGSSSKLRDAAIRFILRKTNWRDQEIGGVCQYLCNTLAWCEMRHFTLINDWLVKCQSAVLLDPRVQKEVEEFTEACEAISSHICPQFYMYVSSSFELFRVRPLRFPTLIAVAQELERRDYKGSAVFISEAISTAGEDPTIVEAFVELHCFSQKYD